MKAGDTVQVTHLDGGTHWIYATVITPNDDGSALVQVQHPGNIEHGAIKLMPKDKVRGKAELQAELDELKANAGESTQEFRQRQAGLFAQLDRLC